MTTPADIVLVQFARQHDRYNTSDTYAFARAEAERFVAAGLAREVRTQPERETQIALAAEQKRAGTRSPRVTKG